MKQITVSILILTSICLSNAQDSKITFADKWEFMGKAVEEPGYTIWGTSPIMADDGKVHLFVARWPCELKADPGWRSHSEIAHYVGDAPERSFTFSDVALKGTGEETWNKFGMHNPAIHKTGDSYVLLYIANSNPNRPQHPNGGYFLYFKSEKVRMGLAVAENLEGSYVQLPFPVGIIESGGGILWTSDDGIHFNTCEKGFHRINDYTEVDMEKVAVHYGPKNRDYVKFERPQILLKDGVPQYLYAPSGMNIYGGDCTVSYVLKYKNQ